MRARRGDELSSLQKRQGSYQIGALSTMLKLAAAKFM